MHASLYGAIFINIDCTKLELQEVQDMIIYFSGTGNSRYIAKRIADNIRDELIDANDKIKRRDTRTIQVNDRLVVVTPTYAWRIPWLVRDWIRKTYFQGVRQVWFVMSCGAEIGNAAKYNRLLCEEKDFDYMGTAQIVMPENYIALFHTPETEKARQIVSDAEPVIDNVCRQIVAGHAFAAPRNNLYDRVMSGPVNKLFYPLCVKAKAFHVSDDCIGCGKCVKLCPLNNITLENNKPVWGRKCTHCMACISYCPEKAIEYGKKSSKKERYYFEKL